MVTVVRILAASYVSRSALQAGSAAAAAAERKSVKYSSLSSSHIFNPVAVESLGSLADDARHILNDIGKQEGQHPLTGQRAPPISGGT